jgi:hypothetical protein
METAFPRTYRIAPIEIELDPIKGSRGCGHNSRSRGTVRPAGRRIAQYAAAS